MRVRVEQPSKTTAEGDKKTVARSLKIFVSNSANEPLELKVKFALLGRDLSSKDITVILEGDRPASVKPRAMEMVETNTANAVMTEARQDKGKRIPPTGVRFIGYGVKVFNGDVLVAEAFEPLIVKQEWGQPLGQPKDPSKPARPTKPEGKPGTLGI